MPEMPNPAAAGAPPQAAPKAEPGKASQLLADTHSNLMELMDMVSKSPEAADGKAPLQAALQAVTQFADVMGGGPGPQAPAPEPKGGAVPMESGAAKVQPAI
jgi:hypothetical protein